MYPCCFKRWISLILTWYTLPECRNAAPWNILSIFLRVMRSTCSHISHSAIIIITMTCDLGWIGTCWTRVAGLLMSYALGFILLPNSKFGQRYAIGARALAQYSMLCTVSMVLTVRCCRVTLYKIQCETDNYDAQLQPKLPMMEDYSVRMKATLMFLKVPACIFMYVHFWVVILLRPSYPHYVQLRTELILLWLYTAHCRNAILATVEQGDKREDLVNYPSGRVRWRVAKPFISLPSSNTAAWDV